jgi:hypothetical protein
MSRPDQDMSAEEYPRIWPAGRALAGPVRHRAGVATAYVVLTALALFPLVLTPLPPLVDYPDHLARMWILLHGNELPALASNYVTDWRLLPNLAMDLIVPALAQIMPLEIAGRLFVAATMAMLVLATAALHRVFHGRVGGWPLTSLFFLYNAVLFWGFLNYLFSLGVALLVFSAWVASERWPTARRVAAFAIAGCVLFVLHLFAFGVYGLLVAAYEAGNRLGLRRWSLASIVAVAIRLMQFIPAGLLWLVSLPDRGPSFTSYGTLAGRGYDILAPTTFDTMPTPFDRGMLVFALLFVLYARHTKTLHLAPAARFPLMAMLAGAVLMPNWLSGSWGADLRLPVTLPFLAIAAARLDRPQRRAVACFAAAALALFGLRIWTVSVTWRDMGDRFAEFRDAAKTLPEGTRLLVAQGPMPEAAQAIPGLSPMLAARQPQQFWHVPELAVIDRSVLVPYLFTGWTPVQVTARNADRQQSQSMPVTPWALAESVSPDWDPASAPANAYGEPAYWLDWQRKFDYALVIDFGEPLPEDLAMLQPVASGSYFHLYRIAP